MLSFENSLNLSPSSKRKNIPDGMWNRCEVCGDITFSKELDRNFKICPKCGYHYPMATGGLIRMLIPSKKNFTEYKSNIKIHSVAFGSSLSASVIAGEAKLCGYQIVLCIINSNPIDDSSTGFNLNKTEYEKILYTFNNSLMKSLPLITFYADGTRLNLKSEKNSEWLSFIVSINLAATIEKLSQKDIPHITVLMNPRVSSEFSTSFPLGDIVLAEPKPVNPKSIDKKNSRKTKSSVAFCTITKNISLPQLLPENYLIDKYVNRRDLKKTLTKILSFCIG
ncbi:hypothetical protein H8E77_17965 [bacterium]|nr:hypothetical protein [bacterium]